MIDASHWDLRGPVRTLRSETAGRVYERNEWETPRFFQFIVFDENGRVVQLDQRGAQDTIFRTTFSYDDRGRLRESQAGTAGDPAQHRTLYTHDEAGRLTGVIRIAPDGTESASQASTFDARGRRTTVQYLPPELADVAATYSVEGSDIGYGAPGAATETTRYDEQDRSVEALFHDANGQLIRRVVLTRDAAGRVVREEAQMTGGFDLPDAPDMPEAEREKLLAFATRVFGTMRTEYVYDDHGRLIREEQHMGVLGERRATYEYDDRGNRVAEHQVSVRREMSLDEEGNPTAGDDTTSTQDSRREYRYDAYGNWTERIVLARFSESGEYTPSNVEWRTIEYR